MKKVIIFSLILFLSSFQLVSAANNTLTASVTFNWTAISQEKRDEIISNIHSKLFTPELVSKYSKKEFRNMFSKNIKDKNNIENYVRAQNGIKESKDANIAGFFINNNILISYALQYKNNMKRIFYYNAIGKLAFVDFLSDEYPSFPYYSYQYSVSGKLRSVIYFATKNDQYVYSPEGKFVGRWYKDKMYSDTGKVKMTRSNW